MIEYLFVEPEFPVNLGAIARAMMNFNVKQMHIVNPIVDMAHREVKMYSKNAYVLVENAKVYRTIEDAIEQIRPDIIVGTSGVTDRFRRGVMRKHIQLKDAKARLAGKGKVLVLFGRESIGLNENETRLCNFFINIPTSPEYPVMNLSHSFAVVAYELQNVRPVQQKVGDIDNACRIFNSFTETLSKKTQVRKRDKILTSFRSVISRAVPTPSEANSIIAVLFRAEKVLAACPDLPDKYKNYVKKLPEKKRKLKQKLNQKENETVRRQNN